MVSILVVMEFGLKEWEHPSQSKGGRVSILVVMEFGLKEENQFSSH